MTELARPQPSLDAHSLGLGHNSPKLRNSLLRNFHGAHEHLGSVDIHRVMNSNDWMHS